MDYQKESVLAFVSAVGELDEPSALEALDRLAGERMGPRDIQMALELGIRIVDGKYRRGEYFIADRLYANRLYARIMAAPTMRFARLGGAPAVTVILGSLPGDMHDAGNEAAVATLRARGFRVLCPGMGVPVDALARIANGGDRIIVALHCSRPRATEELSDYVQCLRQRLLAIERLIIWGDVAFASLYRELGADSYAEDVLSLVDRCLPRSSEASR